MIRQRVRSYKVILLIADALGIGLSYFAAFWISVDFLGKSLGPDRYLDVFPWVLIGWLVVFRFSNLYNIQLRGSEELLALVKGVLIAVLVTLGVAFFYRPTLEDQGYFTFSRTLLVLLAFLTIPTSFIFRKMLRWGRYRLFKSTRHFNRLIIIGRNNVGFMLANELQKHDLGYELVGFVEDDSPANNLGGVNQTCTAPEGTLPDRQAGAVANPLGLTGSECWDRSPAAEISDGETRPENADRDTSANAWEQAVSQFPVVGRIDQVKQIISDRDVSDVWIALPSAPRDKLMKLVELCLKTKVSWKIVPDLYEVMLDWVRIDSLSGVPLIGIKRSNITGLNVVIKRAMDMVFSSILIVLTALPMLLAVVLVKLTSPGPVLFKQKRVGQNGRRFVFLKFRSMYHKSKRGDHKDFTREWITQKSAPARNNSGEKQVYKITNDSRITPVGKFLRKTSIDELPQIFSVLKGDMSLIGPRPPLAYEVEHYREWHKRRLEVKPGITGLWQISGRNFLSFEEMVKLDIYYIENWSVRFDLKIIFKTVFTVLFGKAY